MNRLKITSKEEFEKIVGENLIVVLYFFKENDKPCAELSKKLEIEFEKHMKSVKHLAVVEFTLEKNKEFMKYFKITAVPTVMMYFKGKVVWFKEQDDDCNVYEIDRFMGNNPDIPYYLFKMVEYLLKIR